MKNVYTGKDVSELKAEVGSYAKTGRMIGVANVTIKDWIKKGKRPIPSKYQQAVGEAIKATFEVISIDDIEEEAKEVEAKEVEAKEVEKGAEDLSLASVVRKFVFTEEVLDALSEEIAARVFNQIAKEDMMHEITEKMLKGLL